MLNNLFGDKKKGPKELIQISLSKILEKGGFSLSFQVKEMEEEENSFKVDIFGEDEGLLKNKRGRLLLAFQTYLLRYLYNQFPEDRVRVYVDSNGFWEENEKNLLDLTDRLVDKALDTNRPVTFGKDLSPNQRRLVHERVSGNTGVRSVSIGNGTYKTMKLIPDTFRSDER